VKRRQALLGLATTALLGMAAVATPSYATNTTTDAQSTACSVLAGSVNAAGGQSIINVTAGTPPTMSGPSYTAGVFAPGKVRLSATFTLEPNVAGFDKSGYVVEGDALYSRFYNPNVGADILTRVGGGWTNFTAFEVSEWINGPEGNLGHTNAYALRSDGTLFRWNLAKGWKTTGSATGFSSIKAMALISKTATYDTFLATTRGGALYTIHIPITSPMKPVVKKVRTSGWQGFESLVAAKCGQYGTLLLGIDKDAKTGNLYAVGHGNGASTVIQGLGKVAGTFSDSVYFRWASVADLDPLNGE
jgi:hypothetical protein